ncbi:MAG: hypothetical protein PHF86_05745 [Candidatus Nanoarchaeia archaeon]|nr:hypothetical protein [Candidatus Nanoarchaeia archaeon]
MRYVNIQGLNISMQQLFWNNNYFDTQKLVLSRNEKILKPAKFMKLYLPSVIKAYNDDLTLKDSKGNLLDKGELIELYKNLTHYCFVWLNQQYKDGRGFKGLNVETIISYNKEDGFISEQEPLEECLWGERVLIDLDPENFNHQGLPKLKAKSKIQKYSKGKNIHFSFPRQGAVAKYDGHFRFSNFYGESILDCSGSPGLNDEGLGAFIYIKEKND